MSWRGERGAGLVGSLIALFLGGGILLVVGMLFLTGLAQERILPQIRARAEASVARAQATVEGSVERAKAGATRAVPAPLRGGADEDTSEDASEGSAFVAGASGAVEASRSVEDSLLALRSRLETERRLLEQRRAEMARLRAGVDSLFAAREAEAQEEIARQSKLLAGMPPAQAARVLSALDDETAARLLDAMNARAASKVLAQLEPRRVARLSLAALGEAPAAPRMERQPVIPASAEAVDGGFGEGR